MKKRKMFTCSYTQSVEAKSEKEALKKFEQVLENRWYVNSDSFDVEEEKER